MLILQFKDNIGLIIPWLCALVIAITIHEFSHGFVAYELGDDTAERAGRLTLNPLAHLDVIGSIMLLLVGFGWAKPVPINPFLIKKGRLGRFLVSVAGIFSNVIIAILGVLALKILLSYGQLDQSNYLIKFLAFICYINIALFIFNLIPIAPLDGYRMVESFAPRFFERYALFIERWGFIILLALVFLTNIIGGLIGLSVGLFSALSGVNIFYLVAG